MFDVHVAFHARMRPRAPAVITPKRRATYAEFDADVNRYAAALQALGVGPARGVVSIETPDPYRHAVMLTALARLGVTAGVLKDERVDLRISDRPGESTDRVLRLSRAWIGQTEQAAPSPAPSAERDPDSLARVLLSSGAAKAPCRVPQSWRQVDAGSLNLLGAYAAGRLGVWAIRTGLDSGFGAGLSAAAWTVGAAVAVGFLTADLTQLLERHPAGLAGLTPVQLRDLLAALPTGYELKPGWRVVVTGATLSAPVAREARARLTPDIIVDYGTNETGVAAIGAGGRVETRSGAVGWPAPGATLQVVGPEGTARPDGEPGEIRIRTGRTATGYLDDPQETARAFRDGFFYTGDGGRRLAAGSFVVDGRADERMDISGLEVLPDGLENALVEHPQVKDAAAFSMPDASGADACWIAVVTDGDVSRESLLAHLRTCAARLPPVRFAWTEAIPRSEAGRIDREALRTQTAAALSKSGVKSEA